MKVCSKRGAKKPTVNSSYVIKWLGGYMLSVKCAIKFIDYLTTQNITQNTKLYRERAKTRRETLKKEFRQNMLSFLKKCTMCGESDIKTFELDHIHPSEKLFNISQAVRLGYSWSAVEIEFKKCRILCANCYKKHTAAQANWYKNI